MSVSVKSDSADMAEGWGTSFAFWLCLLLAAGCYATVALSPKLLTYLELQAQYDSNQRQLVSLEQQVETLQRVVHAIENEPEFVAEIARIDFHAARPDDERFSVDASLQLGATQKPGDRGTGAVAGDGSHPLLRVLSYDPLIRRTALGIAIMLAVAAFTFLQEPAPGRPKRKPARRRHILRTIVGRYAKP